MTFDSTTRSRAIAAARGQTAFDTLLTGGVVVDVATSELRPADIGIVGPMIASVHAPGTRNDAAQRHDVSGRWLSPGLIDTHVHFESSHMTPANYAAVVVPQGTTTIFYDPHELANVLGLEGVRYAIEASRGLPLRFLCAAPSCVPSAPGLETAGAEFGGDEMRTMLAWPEVAGVAEMMDLSGADLQAYMAAGVSSDHEITSAADGLEKLRAGITVELRGSHDHLLPDLVAAINQLPQTPSTLTI